MMDAWRTEWANNKKDIAYKLNSGECGGFYGDAVLILCSVLGALAAEVWPGYRKDRKRFVELLKQFATPKLEATKISIPLLTASLLARGKGSEAGKIEEAFLKNNPGNVLIGDEVDKKEVEILPVCGDAASLKELRECSYANLLYREVRCGYVHEYKPGKKGDSCPLTKRRGVHVSYVGWIDANHPNRDPEQHIHFALEWIGDIVTCVATAVDQVNSLPFPDPPQWWVDGCSVFICRYCEKRVFCPSCKGELRFGSDERAYERDWFFLTCLDCEWEGVLLVEVLARPGADVRGFKDSHRLLDYKWSN